MKFAFSIKNKIKIAFLLFCIMCCSLLIRILEDKSVAKINESFVSMYHDRLVPATDLYFVAENLYHKNGIFQDVQGNHVNFTVPMIFKIKQYNLKIDSVLHKYELTLLVAQEKTFLNEFKKSLAFQEQLEDKIFGLTDKQENGMDANMFRKASAETLAKLSALIKIQSQVGDELIRDSKIFVSGTKVYSTLQGFLAVAIGVMIVSLVSASKIVNIQQDKFNLN